MRQRIHQDRLIDLKISTHRLGDGNMLIDVLRCCSDIASNQTISFLPPVKISLRPGWECVSEQPGEAEDALPRREELNVECKLSISRHHSFYRVLHPENELIGVAFCSPANPHHTHRSEHLDDAGFCVGQSPCYPRCPALSVGRGDQYMDAIHLCNDCASKPV
jgi:hypothetical protein